MAKRKKLFLYVDEAGQDVKSRHFVVVVVVIDGYQDTVRDQIQEVERTAKTGKKKWHKLRHVNRIKYIKQVLQKDIGSGNIHVGIYSKPVPFFAPMITVIEEAIKREASGSSYQAQVYIDGIDKQKAKEVTNVLRGNGITLKLVRGKRDESEPLIRLADMWAGCIRRAYLEGGESKNLYEKVVKTGYAIVITQ